MTPCRRLGAAAMLARSAPRILTRRSVATAPLVRASFAPAHVHNDASFAPALVRHLPCTVWTRRDYSGKAVTVMATTGGDGGGNSAGSDANAMWKLALAAGSAGLMLVVARSSPEAQCDAAAQEMLSDGQKKIDRISSEKKNTKPGSFMAKIEVYGTMIVPYVNMALNVVDVIAPYIVKILQTLQAIYNYLPTTLLEALGGLAMCFFGGLYPLTIAAAETFRVSGGDEALSYLTHIWEELVTVHQANQADNKRDDDGDGVADVDQISKQQLMSRKTSLFLKTVNPSKLLDAYGGLAKAFAGVCATLKLQFAKVIALAVSIADAIRPVMIQFVAPLLVALIPSDYHKWVYPIIDVFCKIFAGSVAWFLYRIVAAVHSGIIGGLICTRALMRWANEKKYLSWKHEDTMLDEYLGWCLAATGVYFQVSNWMSVPFPLNILFLPVTMCETYLQWVVTWMD
mmetsp:Transcript_14521/g.21198  ORF Transcript_14521/g.21198 Transcript_14521/m.21198 type:complete len:456 (+) Transcript_14521:91-1458(+)